MHTRASLYFPCTNSIIHKILLCHSVLKQLSVGAASGETTAAVWLITAAPVLLKVLMTCRDGIVHIDKVTSISISYQRRNRIWLQGHSIFLPLKRRDQASRSRWLDKWCRKGKRRMGDGLTPSQKCYVLSPKQVLLTNLWSWLVWLSKCPSTGRHAQAMTEIIWS